MNIAGLQVISGSNVDPQAIADGAAAIPFHRAQVGEAQALVRDECVLCAWHEFDRFFERAYGNPGALVQGLDGLDGRLAGAAGQPSHEQKDRHQENAHLSPVYRDVS